MSVLTRKDILDPESMVARAEDEIRESGAPASDALAKLVDELMECTFRNMPRRSWRDCETNRANEPPNDEMQLTRSGIVCNAAHAADLRVRRISLKFLLGGDLCG